MQWINKTLTWSYDDGPLSSSVDNAEAVQWVTEAVDAWANGTLPDPDNPSVDTVQVADVQHVNAGSVGADLTAANLADYYYQEGVQALIVFDDDGSIVGEWFDPTEVPGLTMLYGEDETGQYITRGIIILNGLMLNTLSESEFKAALFHEIGHLYNLDHSQVNWDVIPASINLGDSFDFSGNVPTMYPFLITVRQGDLVYDDKIGLGWVYPRTDFENKYCTIKGKIKDSDGNPLQGVYVTARYSLEGSITARVDARGMVSGSAYPPCTANGEYVLRGIRPGRSYHVTYEPIGEQFTEASGFEPFPGYGDYNGNGTLEPDELFPPYDFSGGTITKGGDTTVTCSSGGNVIEMDDVQVDVTNPCSAQGGVSETGTTTTTSTGKSGMCSLSEDVTLSSAHPAWIILFCSIAIVATVRSRYYKKKICRL